MVNPGFFDYLTNSKLGKEKTIKQDEKKEIILEHLHNSLDHYGEEVGIKSFRKHLSWYSKSLTNSNEFRYKVNKSVDKIEVENLIKQFLVFIMENGFDEKLLKDFVDNIPEPILILKKKIFKY